MIERRTSDRAKVLDLLRRGWRLSAEWLPGSSYKRDFEAVRCMLYRLTPETPGAEPEVWRVDQELAGRLAREGSLEMTAVQGNTTTYKLLEPASPYAALCAERGVLGPEGVTQ